jgi:putative hemolysin
VNGIGGQLALVGFLIVLNAAFAGSEIALISLREGQLARLEQRSARGRALARLARQPNRFLSTIQIGITLAGFLASATAAVSLAEPLVEPLGFLGGAARPAAIFAITLALTFVTLVFGELAPKRLAMQRAEPWALLAARPLTVLARLTAPAIWLLSHATDLTVRLFGGDPDRDRQEVTEEEIRDLIATQSTYTDEQRQIIDGALEVADRTLRQIVVPRSRVVGLPAALPVDEALSQLAAAGHSRAPVYTSELDDADRTISVLGLLGGTGTVADHARPALALPESLNAVAALRQLQAGHQQLAVVVSEHGGVEGIITVEDLVEELVGEIYDEHDRDIRSVVHAPDGSLELPGAFPLHDLVDIDIDIPQQTEVTTIGGLLIDRLGRIPQRGDEVEVHGLRLVALSIRHRAPERVRLERLPEAAGDADASGVARVDECPCHEPSWHGSVPTLMRMQETTDDGQAGAPPASGDGSRRRRRGVLATSLAVVGMYAVGLAVVGIEESLDAVRGVAPLPLVGAGILQVAVMVLWSKVYAASAGSTGAAVGTWRGLQVTMPAFTLSHALPGGGWAGNAFAVQRLARFGMQGPAAFAAVALASTISMTAVAALGATGIVLAFVAGDLPTVAVWLALPVLFVLAAVVVAVVSVLRSPRAGDRVVGAVGRVLPPLRRRVDDWRGSLRDVTEDPPSGRQLSAITGWALLKWGADIASLALVFVAVGATPRVTALLVGFGVTQLATAVPVTPGGAGFVEGGMVGAFVALGYPASTATTVVILYRILATWLPTLAGVPMLLRARRGVRWAIVGR